MTDSQVIQNIDEESGLIDNESKPIQDNDNIQHKDIDNKDLNDEDCMLFYIYYDHFNFVIFCEYLKQRWIINHQRKT